MRMKRNFHRSFIKSTTKNYEKQRLKRLKYFSKGGIKPGTEFKGGGGHTKTQYLLSPNICHRK